MGLTEGQRQGVFKPQVRENSQMARLCDLADPLVDLLYVVPFKLPEVSDTCVAPFQLPDLPALCCALQASRGTCYTLKDFRCLVEKLTLQ